MGRGVEGGRLRRLEEWVEEKQRRGREEARENVDSGEEERESR